MVAAMVAAMVVVVGQRDYGKHCACLPRKKLDYSSISQSIDAQNLYSQIILLLVMLYQ